MLQIALLLSVRDVGLFFYKGGSSEKIKGLSHGDRPFYHYMQKRHEQAHVL